MEFLVADAERMYTVNGRLQHLSYWSYKILARSFLESYQNPPLLNSNRAAQNFSKGSGYVDFCTWHRYSEFEWLAAQVELEFPGMLFPPIPSKETDGTVDKFTELLTSVKENNSTTRENPLVKKRMRQLQLTFNAIAQLHELHESPLLKAFVTLDELSWCAFREEREKKMKTSILTIFKAKGLSIIAKLRSFRESSNHDYTLESPLDSVATRQSDLGELLNTCFAQVEYINKYCISEWRHWSDVNKLRGAIQGSPMPWTACYGGHLVQHSKHPGLEGVVREINNNAAVVEWNGQGGRLSKVPLDELNYPSSGISDPAIFAIQELASQVESYFMYLSRSSGVAVLRDVEDLLWFLSSYANRCVRVIRRFREMRSEVRYLTRVVEKKASVEQFEQLERLKQILSKGTSRFMEEYNIFYRSFMRNSLMEVAQKFGRVMTVIMSDDQWNERLSVAKTMLTLSLPLLPEEREEIFAEDASKRDFSPMRQVNGLEV
ncbi:hypothetical protein TCSYLVIO_003704 [Trypanosoma cruzi]|nr:hypothetical protein TCSYLVIO_003704 [Trypanosoma cruzi]